MQRTATAKADLKSKAKSAAAEEHAAAKQAAPTSVQPGHTPIKPEDARLVGAGRSEQQEWLEKNVTQGQAQQHPDTPAGQHATGSFTGENARKKK
jgi:hypothetical protein